ncbi:MAG: PTS sugar transporter subunit IIA [Candidatus Omnitrophica bacterium]|nr:PTS sugar transporter subunit IIA [Candidatus Omnitrophota bacterium]MCF7892004.1 PTS sugar transporter subunit IIA [Candidatus Omnitrophota bacterium]MCF7896004.1 PTS sugar transporter subunit IIA [Candidatus Omnitrophota bacterium]MCF7897470.1 PTS sugar transporter subunit IIA [Candidatus Omnitrophota bacterium]MCF7909251.1 PTS sugar transporter subunit IIA [Candidatus Omnitrophota bacterium]
MNKNQVLTTKELAEYIKLNEKTIIKMAQTGEIPGVKVGSQWRFHIDAIDSYLQNKIIKSPEKKLNSIIKDKSAVIPLSRLVENKLIELDLGVRKPEKVLSKLTNMADSANLTHSPRLLYQELLKREKMLSTAVGQKVAIPHPRYPSDQLFRENKIVIAISKEGINYDEPDKDKVHLFFMICALSEAIHIRLLAMISKLIRESGSIDKFIKAKSEDEIIRLSLEFERKSMFFNNPLETTNKSG